MSKIFYAQENIRNKFKDYTSPKTREQLVNLYALTDDVQKSENIISTLYSTANNSWGTEITLEQSDNKPYTYCIYNNGQIGNAPKDKYFVLTDNYYFADSPTNSTRWYTLDEMAQKPVSVSLSNVQPDIFSKTTGEKVPAYQYTDKQGITKYLIRKDKLENEANFRWLTYDEVEDTEYSFEEIYKPLHFVNVGTNSATVQLEMNGCRLESSVVQDDSLYKMQYSMDGIIWDDYQTYDFRNVPASNPIIIQGPQITIEPNKAVYFRCDDPIFIWQANTYFHFILSESSNIKAYGNLACMFFGKLFGTVDIKEGEVYFFTLTNMFKDCTSLLRSPIIPESTHTFYECTNMFNGCINLTEVHSYIGRDYTFGDDETLPQYLTGSFIGTDWMVGVSQNGNFYCHSKEIYKLNSADGIPDGWNIHFIKPLCIKAYRDACVITLENIINSNGISLDPIYEYTTDKAYNVESHWKPYEIGAPIHIEKNSTIYIRGHRNKTISYNSFMHFKVDGTTQSRAIFSGNILSLISEDKNIYSTSNTYPNGVAGDGGVFYKLFYGCTKLLFAPEIPTTKVPVRAYSSMFNNCTSLRMNTKLYASNLKADCYLNMYNGCCSIESQRLDATSYEQIQEIFPSNSVMSTRSCSAMFSGCTSLKVHPYMRVSSVAEGCYANMFSGCTSLQNMPTLPATNLAVDCYRQMFYGCVSLNNINIISADSLAERCCYGMFNGCSSMTTAPKLLAKELVQDCYKYMFANCTKLNSIEVHSKTNNLNNENYTFGWVVNVSKTGIFRCINENLWTKNSNHGIPTGWSTDEIDYPLYLENLQDSNSMVKLTMVGAVANVSYEYSYDLSDWKYCALDDVIILQNKNNKVYFRGSRGQQSVTNYIKFNLSGKLSVGGNINSLLSPDDSIYKNITDYTTFENANEYTFHRLFYNQSALYDASELKLSTDRLSNNCYSCMFYGCASLVQAPALPAIDLSPSCYKEMFYGCTSLTKLPKLSASTMAISCYAGMFQGCTSIKNIIRLNSVTLKSNCYRYMFSGCTSMLLSNPDESSYGSMYELPAKTLADNCYSYMFENCSSMEGSIILPAETSKAACYNGMFKGCINLHNVFCYLTVADTDCTNNWLADAFGSGTIYYLKTDLLSDNSVSGTPSGWQKLQIYKSYVAKGHNIVFDDALELPARDINGNEIELGYSICNFYENKKDSVNLYRIESGIDTEPYVPYIHNTLYVKSVSTNGVVNIGSTSNIIVSRIDFVVNKTKEESYDMYDVVGLAKTVNSNKIYSQYIWATQMERPADNSNTIPFYCYPKNRDLIYSLANGDFKNAESIPSDRIIEVIINDTVSNSIYAFPNPYDDHPEFRFSSYKWGNKPACEFILNGVYPSIIARAGAIAYLPKPILIGDNWFELGGDGISNNICTIGSDNVIIWNKDNKLYKMLDGVKIK